MKGRRILLVLVACLMQAGLYAQNDLEISAIRSPQFDFNYEITDSVNVEATLLNNGPNVIFGTDYVHFDIKISNPDTTIFYNVSLIPLQTIAVNNVQIFTLLYNVKFDSEADYQVCVNVSGTDQYPTNTSKKTGPCLPFAVGVEEAKIEASKIYFGENSIRFELNNSLPNTQFRILDLSGKVLRSGDIKQEKEQVLNFKAPARGLYFLQLHSASGQQSTYKFIVR